MYNIPHDIYGDTEDKDSSYQQSSGGDAKNKYNLNNLNANFGNFFKSDINSFGNEDKKKKEIEREETNEKKSRKGSNKFMNDLFDEIGDSGLNNNSSKASQKESKIKNKSINKSTNKNNKKDSIDNDFEELGVNRDDNEIEEIEINKDENEMKESDIKNEIENNKKDENEVEKMINMEKYLKEHQKINMVINMNKKEKEKEEKNKKNEENISEQSNEIEENINSNSNNNIQKNNSIKEEDEDYGGFDNLNSETINNQNIQTSSKKNDKSKKNTNNTNSNINKQVLSSDSYNKYLGEFEQSKINEINKIEESNNNKNNDAEKIIKAINDEHKKTTKNLMIKNENINSNNNINNIINSNNFINSVGSGDSINVNNLIKNEVNKYDNNDKPGYKKEEYINLPYTFKPEKKTFVNLRKISEERFSIKKATKKQTDLLKLKNEEALRQERNKRQMIESELETMKEEYAKLLEEMKIMSNQKNEHLNELKNDFEYSLKNMENTVLKREKQKFDNLIKDMENKYQTDIIKKTNEIEKLKNEYEYLENRYNNLDNEYKKLKESKENEEQINNLKNENFRLYAQINEIKHKKNKNQNENDINDNNNKKNKNDTNKIYEQLLNEREINTQEKLLNNYLKEIKKLNEEIIFLKSINSLPKNKGIDSLQQSNEPLSDINKTNPKINNYIINPSLQESAEKQIKKLQNFLLPSSNDPMNNKLLLMEKEFTRLQNKESPNEITFTNYINVMKQFKVPLSSNELIEIFNNFPRIKGDRIRMNDFINALNSKSPSTFFLQSDPSYLNELESKLIKGQNRIKELEKFIIDNNNENEEFKLQLKKSMEENKLLKNKINELNSQILQYFLFREEKNISNPDVIQMKEKMRTMEIKNKTMDNELSEKFGKYEKKIEELQKNYEDEKINLLKEKDGFKEQINKLKNEKEKDKNEYDKKEILLKTEINQLNEKLQKYKKNYSIMINKNEINKKEKEKILNSFKDKGLDPEQILAFVNNASNIQEILDKINELERKNLNREEIYKRICLQVNQNQINKELEKIKKKHEDEKKGLLKIITQKNNELNSIKAEFFGIMNELEKLKANKFK